MAKITNYPFKCFKQFANTHERLTSSSLNSYCVYLRNILAIKGCEKYLDEIYAAQSNSQPALMIGIVNEVILILDKRSDYNNEKSAIQVYKRYIEYVTHKHINVEADYREVVENPSCSNFSKKQLSGALDSMKVIESTLGGADKFIKLAIESSYFFEPQSVICQFKNVCNSNLLSARISTKDDEDNRQSPLRGLSLAKGSKAIFTDGSYTLPIILDADNNSAVRTLINKVTGYTVAAGKMCIFQNYIISHIWGNATDPRYFTNLWNIVLVPAWANHLLDKDTKQGSTAAKFKATMMAICEKFYNMNNLSWSGLKMSQPKILNPNDVVQGNYTINVIGAKGKDKLGIITRVSITI